MRIGIIGLGARSTKYTDRILNNPEFKEHTVSALCDNDKDRLLSFSEYFFGKTQSVPACYSDWKDLLADVSVEGVIITTPDYTHKEIAIAAMQSGKHIMLEKPIDTTVVRAGDIYRAGKTYDKTLLLGFVLRYSPFYRRIKEIIASGELGKIITVSASENLNRKHSSSYFRRWHRFRKYSGGLMNTKCCHDIDMLSFLLDDRIVRISSFGSSTVFVSRPDAAEHCCDCKLKDECIYSFDYTNYGDALRWDCQKDICVYNSEKDVLDRQVMILEFSSGILASFELALFSGEETRQIRINGTKATLVGDFGRMSVKIMPVNEKKEVCEFTVSSEASNHGGGDDGLLRCYFESAQSQTPINDVYDGYLATVAAICSDVSAREKRTVLLDEFLLDDTLAIPCHDEIDRSHHGK